MMRTRRVRCCSNPDRPLRVRVNASRPAAAKRRQPRKKTLPMQFGFGGGGMRFENGMGVFFRGSAQGQWAAGKLDVSNSF